MMEEFNHEDEVLAKELRKLAQNLPIHPDFEAALEGRLMETAQKSKPPSRSGFSLIKAAAWGAAALFLLFGLAWALANLIPRGSEPAAPPAIQTATPAGAEPIPTETTVTQSPTDLPEPTVTPASTPTGEIYSLSIQPEVDFFLQASFPESPAEAGLYRQVPWEAVTIDAAQATAAQLGVQGEVYLFPNGNSGAQSYLVWDGNRRVIFQGSSHSFEYESGNSSFYEQPTCQAPCLAPGTEDVLMSWLSGHGLADILFDTRLSETQPQVEYLVQMLDGIPLLYSPSGYQGQALIGSQGQVLRLSYQPANLENLGTYPILSAEQAWQTATATDLQSGVEFTSHTPASADFHNWQRSYPLNEAVELFGNLQVFQPAAGGGAPLVLFDGDPVQGNIQGMAEAAANNPFVQVWGQYQPNEQGGRTLHVEGWQRSAFQSQTLAGTIVRQDGRAYLHTENRVLRMPELPADVPEGQTLTANGVIIEQPEPTLAWSSISTQFGGGGGGGGSGFFDLNLAGDSIPSPTQPPATATPSLTGQRLEGVQGRPIVSIHQYSDGSTRVEVIFYADTGQLGSDPFSAYLEGPGLAGIEAFHNLPVRIWGTFGENQKGLPTVNVERVEPVYPNLVKEAWLGRYERVSLEGQDVLLFTAQDGTQFVLNLSLEGPNDQLAFSPGDPIVVEGYIIPEKTYAGYPVVQDLAIHPGQGLSDLNDYQTQSLAPAVLQEPGVAAGAARKATVTAIELVYYTDDLRYLDAAAGSPLPYAQPVWRFTGTYEDGSSFDILVQALDPRYLVQP